MTHSPGIIRINDDGKDEFAALYPFGALSGFTPFEPKIAFRALLGVRREQRQKQTTALDGAPEVLVPVVSRLQCGFVKPSNIAADLL